MPDPIALSDSINYQDGAVVSKEIYRGKSGTITLFAFGEGQGLSKHSTPFDTFISIVEGEATITIAGKSHAVTQGEMIHIPANQPHEVKAVKSFKMLLIMLKK